MRPWTCRCRCLFEILFSVFGYIPSNVSCRSYASSILNFLETSILFSALTAPIIFLPTMRKGILLSISSAILAISCLFDERHPIRWETIHHCSFNLHVPRVGHHWATSLSLSTFMHWRRKWQPTPVFSPGESQGRGSLVGCRLWGCTELDTTEAT